MLEGHSIYGASQNNTNHSWQMVRPSLLYNTHMPLKQGDLHNHVTPFIRSTSPRQHPLHGHLVVVSTPETPHKNSSFDDLKPRLDIRIRVPSQLLLPELISAIDKKLDMTISLFYFDGKQPLSAI